MGVIAYLELIEAQQRRLSRQLQRHLQTQAVMAAQVVKRELKHLALHMKR
jgi:hypothetical protein